MLDLIRSIRKRDPANPTFLEVLFAYNGVHALIFHALAHMVWRFELKALARFIANFSRMLTGIEIHPAAQIGERLFIDHGTGTVIGETAIIEDDVTIYHGVTLGGKNACDSGKRHPTIESGVIIGAGAQVLGNIIIGKNAKIAAHSVVVSDVPRDCTVIGNPARLVNCRGDEGQSYGLPRDLHDPVSEAIDGLLADVKMLKEELVKEKKKSKAKTSTQEGDYAKKWTGSGI